MKTVTPKGSIVMRLEIVNHFGGGSNVAKLAVCSGHAMGTQSSFLGAKEERERKTRF